MSSQALRRAANNPDHPLHMHAKIILQQREVSLDDLKAKISSSGLKSTKKAMGADKLKKDLEVMKARLASESVQEYGGPKISRKKYLEQDPMKETKAAPKGYHFTKSGQLKKGDADVDGPGGKKLRADPLDKQRSKIPPLPEKTLTPAEKKKREEIAKAIERENPGMPMNQKMAIATAQAKKVAEAYKEPQGQTKRIMSPLQKARMDKEKADRDADGKLKEKTGLKRDTLKSYIKKASKDAADRGMDAVDKAKSGDTLGFGKQFVKSRDRVKNVAKAVDKLEDTKPDAAEVMRKQQQMANISSSDKDKLAKIRAMLNKEKK